MPEDASNSYITVPEVSFLSDRRKFLYSILISFLLASVIISLYMLASATDISLVRLGIHPRKADGLIGIITSPLVHGEIHHLIDNVIPLFFLTLAVFYFYFEVAGKVILWGWLLTGFWVWIGARQDAWHIGASGVIYCLASFLFFSGIIRKQPQLLAISLLVTFLYGGMVWGIFPFEEDISWESHLYGAVAGLFLSYAYRFHGPGTFNSGANSEPGDEEGESDEDETSSGEIPYWKTPDPEMEDDNV